MTGVYSDAVDFVISNKGYERFLKWEQVFTKYPLAGVSANLAASRMTWADGELAARNSTNLKE
jgi:hypothetical protein